MVGKVEVGVFTLEDGSVSGPADYMREQGFAHLRRIESGNDVVFNIGAAGESPSVEVAILVSMQTDYAGWKGSRDFFAVRSGLVAS